MHKLIPLLLMAAACSSAEPVPSPDRDGPPPELHRMQPDHAPTPFAAEEIREACAEGAFREYALTENNQTRNLRMVFGPEVDGAAVVDTVILADDGTAATTMPGQPTPWSGLQAHASFPEAMTEITPCRHQVEAGKFEAWTYVVSSPDGTVKTFIFARDLPGPPIDMITWRGGFQTQRMELVDYGPR